MTSSTSKTFAFVAHLPATISAVLATARPFMNSSTVPVTLSDDEVWDAICSGSFTTPTIERLLKLFDEFSDTMQFTEKLRFTRYGVDAGLVNNILKNQIDHRRYFSSTIRHVTFLNAESITLASDGKLRAVTSIDISLLDQGTFDDDSLELVCKNFPKLRKLDLKEVDGPTDDGLAHIANLVFLEDLDLSFTAVAALPLKELKSLKRLVVNGCEVVDDDVFDLGVDDKTGEPVQLPCLQEVDICRTSVTATGIRLLQKHCPNLCSVSCESLEQEGFEAVSRMKNLRKLAIVNGDENMNTENISLLMKNLTCLEVLELEGDSEMNDDFFMAISQTSAPLRVLEMCSCSASNVGLRQILSSLSFLESLKLSYPSSTCTITGEIGSDCVFASPSFKQLYFNSMFTITDSGLKTLIGGTTALTHLHVGCSKITSEGLATALEASATRSSLTSLILSGAAGVKDFRFLDRLPNLKKLNLGALMKIDYSELRGNGFGLNRLVSPLEELNLLYARIEDEDIINLPDVVLRSLRRLYLPCCNKLSRKALLEGVSKMESLEILAITTSSCAEVQYPIEDIDYVANKLGRLQKILVTNGTFQLVEKDPKLRSGRLGQVAAER